MSQSNNFKSSLLAQKTAYLFAETSKYLDLNNENIFTVKAYAKAAQTILKQKNNLIKLIEEKKIKTLLGLNEKMAGQIEEYYQNACFNFLKETKKITPKAILEFLKIPQLDSQLAKLLKYDLQINSISELKKLVFNRKLETLVSAKQLEIIVSGLNFLNSYPEKLSYHRVLPISVELKKWLQQKMPLMRVENTGSLRRCSDNISIIELIACYKPGYTFHELKTILIEASKENPEVQTVCEDEKPLLPKKIKIKSFHFKLTSDYHARLYLLSPEYFLAAWHYLSSTANYWHKLEKNQPQTDLFPAHKAAYQENEACLFSSWNLQYIEPVLREGQNEIKVAQLKKIPQLLQANDLKGLFHVYSLNSGGTLNLLELADLALKNQFSYLGLSENYLCLEDIKNQAQEINDLRQLRPELTIFWGLETDISENGSLAIDLDILEHFDFVIASILSNFTLDIKQQTKRLVSAIKNSCTTILGNLNNPNSNHYLAYNYDLKEVLKAAAEHNCSLEFIMDPQKPNLEWPYLKIAKEQNIKFFLNSHLKKASEIDFIPFSIKKAQKAWFEAKDVINSKNVQQMMLWIEFKKRQRFKNGK